MTRIERVDRVLRGREVDCPPVSLWYHFGVQHGGGERFARTALDFFRYYDFDFLKVMNDYFYPMPAGLEAIMTGADLKRLARFDVLDSPWGEQLQAVEMIGRELSGRAYFIDTVFDPWQTVRRSLAGENIGRLMEEEPEALLDALEVVTENLISYCRKSLDLGAAGIFLSVPACRELVSREHFHKFVRPFAATVLAAVAERGAMNTAHIHGEDLHFDDCVDLPADVFSWWDRGPLGPSLREGKEKTGRCVMGGIDHNIVSRRTGPFLAAHVREGRALGGETRFFLTGGCSIDASVNPRALRAIVAAAREAP